MRASVGLTQVALAKRFGVSFPTVNRWENSKSAPTQICWAQLRKLADGEDEVDAVEAAATVKLALADVVTDGGGGPKEPAKPVSAAAEKDLTPTEIQELDNVMDKLLKIRNETGTQLKFTVRIEATDGKAAPPSAEVVEKLNAVLKAAGVKLG